MTNDKPKISIIVPMYNCAEYAPKCIESIQKQSYKNWELLLIHGDSKDNTVEVCQDYEKNDSRIKNVLHIDGLVGARNVGYDMATGDWMMYVDGDDWIDDDCLVHLVKYINKYDNLDIIFWKYLQMFNDKPLPGKWAWGGEEPLHLYSGDECKELARNTLIYKSGIAEAFAKLIRVDYAHQYNIKHDSRLRQGMEGVEFSLRMFYYANKVLFVNQYYNLYRFNPNSMSKTVSEFNAKCIADSVKVLEEDVMNFPEKDLFVKVLYQRATYAVISVAMSTYFHPANKDPLKVKVKKYTDYINSVPFFKEAILRTSTEGMGLPRKIVVLILRMRAYFLLSHVARLKAYLLKKGEFNY